MNSMTENSAKIPALTEAELRSELLRYRELFEYAPIGIVQTTVDGKILKANPAMARMLGYDPVDNDLEVMENIAENLYARPEKRQQLLALALDREQLFNYENEFRRKDGGIITCRLHIRVVRGDDGQVRFLESFIEDITDQKKTAMAFQESEKLYRGIFENTGAGTIIAKKQSHLQKEKKPMALRHVVSTPSAYDYQLLIKHLLRTPLIYAPNQENRCLMTARPLVKLSPEPLG